LLIENPRATFALVLYGSVDIAEIHPDNYFTELWSEKAAWRVNVVQYSGDSF